MNLAELLVHRARLSPGQEGFIAAGYRLDFAEVNQRVNRLADFLRQRGLGPGQRLAILCKNNEQVGTALFAAAKLGAMAVLLNWRLRAPELAYILADCQPWGLMYDEGFAPLVEELRPDLRVSLFLPCGGQGAGPRYPQCLEQGDPAEPALVGGDHDPVAIMYTSGTTGRPKGAMLSHLNLFWSALAISATVEWNRGQRFLLMAPLFHIGGLAPLVTNVYKGVVTYFLPDFDPVEVWRVVGAERINTMMSVPLMLQAMAMVAQKMPVDASSLLNITCGASAVPEGLIRAYLGLGIKVQQVYGITEFSGAVSFWTHEMGLENCATQGQPVFHGTLRIKDPGSGQDLPAGQVGEICCQGPMVFLGYWNNPQASAQALVDGWYRSGDLGTMDSQGLVRVVDRLKDMIISGGENIYPAEVEAVLAQHPAVAEVAVVGQPDPRWGEVPVAHVALKPQAQASAQELMDLCKERLASFKCVKDVVFKDELPKNPTGKILKTSLRQPAG